ncbi:hypothetical protein PHLCEN_2v3160 [Hermanssonia centrifuga]|uniref:Protein kinase domain-containing protein n=1 Tax=Hermanssonia centrifuga TaxID=98765 RepID=A0A2R6R115_9APHY|nr:hypothetical protein PHLCEN_2v3160 [Hermanssonia centrifuga]
MDSRPAKENWQVISTPLGSAPEVSVQFFLNRFLPPLSSGIDITGVVSSLKRRGRKGHRAITDQGRWRSFAMDPKRRNEPEYDVFAPLIKVAEAISNEGSIRHAIQALDYRHNAFPTLNLYDRTGISRPDAYLVSKGCTRSGADLRWSDIVVPGEYHKEDTAAVRMENAEKISWSMRNCMRYDARRRFIFGFTIENTNMRLWFCDRSQVVICKPFNFITEHAYFTYFLLSVSMTGPHQLGYDPTIKLLGDSEDPRYEITVRSDLDGSERIYRTLGLLSDAGACALRGRGTRVWKAIKIEDGQECGEPVALKDSWIDAGRPREGYILTQMRGYNNPERLSGYAEKFFLTAECYGDVFVDRELGHVDAVRPFLMPESRSLSESDSNTTPRAPTSSMGCEDALISHKKPGQNIHPSVGRQVHHRIVFKEICTSLYREKSLSTIFRLLGQVAGALLIMHDAGWIHHDISPGNILVDENGCAKLTDLEYAQRMDDTAREELRVGTPNFMAVEVDSQCYQYLPLSRYCVGLESTQQDSDPERTTRLIAAAFNMERHGPLLPERNSLEHRAVRPLPPHIPLRYNPIHDLESLWWIAVYFVLGMQLKPDSEAESQTFCADELYPTTQQRYYAGRLFFNATSRFSVMNDSTFFAAIVQSLSPSLHDIGMVLEDVRMELFRTYSHVEQDASTIDHKAAEGLHALLLEGFLDIAGTLQENDLVVCPFKE